jgi:hypothetical protein
MDNTVWRHTVRNACQDQILPSPLFNLITVFNIHNNPHFTILISNNNTYYYYNSLNLRPAYAINMTCGLPMLLINLATIYQGRIPTLGHTQLHADTLSRSHLKYVIIGELDTHVTCLIRELTNQAYSTVRIPRTRNTNHVNTTTTTQNKPLMAPPTSPLPPRKRTHTPSRTSPPNQLTPHSPT